MTSLAVDAHPAAARLEVHELVRQRNGYLGPTLVAALAGTPDRRLPIRWAKAASPTRGTAYRRRLQLAHRFWTLIAGQESDHVARSRFIAGNPLLDEDTPITGTEDRGKDVVAAVEAFIEDQPASTSEVGEPSTWPQRRVRPPPHQRVVVDWKGH